MPLDPSCIHALCFDVDGTLRDTDNQYVKRLAGWLHPFCLLLPSGDASKAARRLVMATEDPGRFLLGLPDWLGIDNELARLGDFIYRLGPGKQAADFLLVPGIQEMLARLRPHYPMSIVTARGERGTQVFLDHFSLTPYFRCVAHAQTCAHTKPYPDPILWSAVQMGVQPAQCLMIGDTVVDIEAGRAAGAQTAGVLCGFGERVELLRAGADVVFCSTAELADYLLSSKPVV